MAIPDTETTLAEAVARIDATIKILESVTPESMEGMEEVDIVLPFGGDKGTTFTGKQYVIGFAIPNCKLLVSFILLTWRA